MKKGGWANKHHIKAKTRLKRINNAKDSNASWNVHNRENCFFFHCSEHFIWFHLFVWSVKRRFRRNEMMIWTVSEVSEGRVWKSRLIKIYWLNKRFSYTAWDGVIENSTKAWWCWAFSRCFWQSVELILLKVNAKGWKRRKGFSFNFDRKLFFY